MKQGARLTLSRLQNDPIWVLQQLVDDQVVDFWKNRMWEKCRGVPLGLERVEVEPFENRSDC